MPNTTTYFIVADSSVVATATKKSKALDLATEARVDHATDVTVVTGAGTVVASLKAPKRIKMSPPYTRVVAVPTEVAETINGKRVAYKRTRVGFALLDEARGAYSVWDLEQNAPVEGVEVATTREFGRWVADESPAYRASLAQA